ncbi:hypothetical protein ACMXZU_04660 [Corynebacterium striatum]
MAKDIPPLVAATGELAVVYRTAAYTWGTYNAAYPEGVEPREFEWGRELGYVGRLDSPPPDLGSRCWIRADVSVDGVEKYSTIPETFDAAEQRSAGDVFFESDIPREGLGRLEVGVDFVRGDIVPVLVANKLLELPVTVADFVSAAGGELDSRVHVGGLMTGSRSEREQNIEMLRRQIRQDSEDWAEALGAERVARHEAIGAASEATKVAYEKAIGESQAAQDVETQKRFTSLTNAITGRNAELDSQGAKVYAAVQDLTAKAGAFSNWSEQNQVAINGAMQLFASAQAAYNDVNTLQWITQADWNAQQQKLNDQQAEINQQRLKFEEQQRLLDDAQSKQIELTKALTAANAKSIGLMNVQNRGSLYMTDTFVIKSGEQYNFSWSGRRGGMVGCHTGSVRDGGTSIKFDSPGDWQIYARVHFPPGSTSGTTTILRINFNDGNGNWSGATCTMYNKGWDQTHSCLMTVSVDNPNAYCYISGFASTTSGALGWTAPAGDQTTEFSVRQLSVKGLS